MWLLSPPGVSAVGAGHEPDLGRAVEIGVGLGVCSSPELAPMFDQSTTPTGPVHASWPARVATLLLLPWNRKSRWRLPGARD